MKKQYLPLVVLLVAVCVAMPAFLSAEATTSEVIASGTCGENLTWTLDGGGTLTISGSGEMEDYENDSKTPWDSVHAKVKSVVIGEGVTGIGTRAFNSCFNLTAVTLADSVTRIGYSAFYGCGKLQYSTYDGIMYLGNAGNPYLVLVKSASKNLSACDIHPDTKVIAESAFDSCTRLRNVSLPNGLTHIGDGAFYQTVLSSVKIPDSVTSIGDNAFGKCTALTSVEIPDSVTSIGMAAFYGCNHLTSVTIGKGVVSIGGHAFHNCEDLTAVYISDIAAWCEITFADIWTNPLQYAQNLYVNGTLLTELIIPDGVTKVGDYAFYNCTGLTSVTMPDSVTYIGDYAFYGCSDLTGVTIADGVVNVGGGAFGLCSSLEYNSYDTAKYLGSSGNPYVALISTAGEDITACTIHPDTRVIADGAFSNCSGLTDIVIPDGVVRIGQFAFSYCSALTSVTIPGSVTHVDWSAFVNCSQLQAVHVTDIGAWSEITFENSDANPLKIAKRLYIGDALVTDLVIPDGTTHIGDYAFYYCTHLTSVTIPDSVTGVGQFAFIGCTQIENVTTGNGVTSIGEKAFLDCKKMIGITLGTGLTYLGERAFFNCEKLTDVYITDIGAWCQVIAEESWSTPLQFAKNFYVNGEPVTEVVIPDGVTRIGDYAFLNRKNLTGITIPDSVTYIGDYAFAYSGLTGLNIPDGVTEIGENAFYAASVTNIAISENAHFCFKDGILYDNPVTKIVWITGAVPSDLVIADGVTSIEKEAFAYSTLLTSVTLPNSLTSIGEKAFYYCSGLTSITLPDGLTSIGNNAFSNCSGLTSNEYEGGRYLGSEDNSYFALMQISDKSISRFTIHEDTVIIADNVFDQCTKLLVLTIPDSVTHIGQSAFSKCTSLSQIQLGNGVTSIADGLFSNCTRLGSVTFGNAVTSIGDSAFSGCTSLSSIVIPDSVTSIGDYAFNKCSRLASVTLGNGVISIGDKAFYNCSKLESIAIPASVTFLGASAFYGCGLDEGVYITDLAAWCQLSFDAPADNPIYYTQKLYVDGKLVTDLVIPEGVTFISDYAFYGCPQLTSVTVSDTVTHIGGYAFYDCTDLTEVMISDSVVGIGYAAFEKCTALKDVHITDVTAWCEISFAHNTANPLCTAQNLYVNGTLLTELVIPEGAVTVGDYVFYNYTNLIKVTIPHGVTRIGDGAFYNCAGLGEIKLPDQLTYIGRIAFAKCTGLTGIAIPETVTQIGPSAFDGCNKLEAVHITDLRAWCDIEFGYITTAAADGWNTANPLRYAGNLYLNGTLVTDLVIPDGVTNIDWSAFVGCDSIVSVTLPDSVTGISAGAFYRCSELKYIVIPDSVTFIGRNAFGSCFDLWHVLYKGTEAQWNAMTIDSYNDKLTDATRHYNCIGDEIVDLENQICALCFQHNYVAGETIAPTCAEQGYTVYTCTICGYSNRDDYVDVTDHSYQTEVIEPTCTGKGYTLYTCTVCGHSYEGDYTAATGHAFGEWEIVLEPTCTEPGSKKHTCFCGHTEYEEIPATGHSYKEWYWVTVNTCTEQGLKRKDCKNCDAFETEQVAAKGHDYEAAVTAPTCSEKGYTTYTCSRCGHSYKDNYVDMVSHGYKAAVTAPTCTEKGYTTYTCPACGDSYVGDYVNALGHDYKTAETASTCTEKGYTTYTCDRCGHSYVGDYVDALDHDYETTETAPTCTGKGYTTYTCNHCGSSYVGGYVDALGHVEVIDAAVAPTCTETGLSEGKHCSRCGAVLVAQNAIPAKGHVDENKDFVCDVCGEKLCDEHTEEAIPGVDATCEKTGLTEGKKCCICGEILKPQEEIPALGHDWAAATCETPKTCIRCGAVEGDVLGHSFGEWTQVKAPTAEETGLAERVCAVCGKTEQKELDKLEPGPSEPTEPSVPTEPTTTPTQPATVPGTTPDTEPVQTVPTTGAVDEPQKDDGGVRNLDSAAYPGYPCGCRCCGADYAEKEKVKATYKNQEPGAGCSRFFADRQKSMVSNRASAHTGAVILRILGPLLMGFPSVWGLSLHLRLLAMTCKFQFEKISKNFFLKSESILMDIIGEKLFKAV